MGIETKGTRQGNTWTKAEGKGLKHGFELAEELHKAGAIALPNIFEHSANKYGESPCIATRKLLERKRIEEGTRTFEKLTLGEYEWRTFNELRSEINKVSAALQTMGYRRGQRVGILAETRAEWLATAIGCLKQGLTVVTLYTNLNDDGFIHGINETEITTLVTSFDILPRVKKVLKNCKLVETVIVFEDQLEGIGNIDNIPANVKIIPYASLLTLGNVEELGVSLELNNEDTAIIMYTSGSTGTPKGVEISHKNIFYALTTYTVQADLHPDDLYIAYLPLAHIMELVTELAVNALGVKIAYSSPFTLTNNSPKIAKGTLGDAKVAKPSALTAVPLILDRIIKSVSENVEKQGKLKTKIFKEALRYKQNYDTSLTNRVLDMIIFNKVKAELGGCVKMMVVGGAPLSSQTYSMIKAMFGCTLQVGYGCTETTANVTSMDSDNTRPGHAGSPNPNVLVRLEDWEEGDYRTTDRPRPRGEIVVGGPCVTKGYFKLPALNEESFFVEDGIRWFRTGDIGEFDETGVLYVIDRKNDLVKLKHGEYVSLGNIETNLKTSNLVENICVVADSTEDHTVAIIVPGMEAFKRLAVDTGFSDDQALEKLCVDDKCIQAFLHKLKLHGKQCGLGRWDIPQAIHLTCTAWNPDNGLVTAALKLKRKAIRNEFQEQIKSLYSKTTMSNGC